MSWGAFWATGSGFENILFVWRKHVLDKDLFDVSVCKNAFVTDGKSCEEAKFKERHDWCIQVALGPLRGFKISKSNDAIFGTDGESILVKFNC